MLVRDVAVAVSGRLVGEGSLLVDRLVHPDDAVKPSDLAVAMSAEAFAALATSKAEAAVVSTQSPPAPVRIRALIVAGHERATMAKLTALFDGGPAHGTGVHTTAVIANGAMIGEGASIGPHVVIGPRTRIGEHSVILSNVSIGADVSIGERSLIHDGVRIGDRVSVGRRAIIHCNAVIGSDGFSFMPATHAGGAPAAPPVARIHSLGTVIIGDDVEIGAGTTIDRATLAATRIGSGTKIDNLVQIAHNVTIGQACLICGMVGISGSVTIGDHVVLGGGVGIADHVSIGSNAAVGAGSGVGTNVPAGARVSGTPAVPHEQSLENYLYLGRQKALHKRVERLQSRIEKLEQSTGDERGGS